MINTPETGLLNADLSRGVNLFLGAGFSTLAKNSKGDPLPTGEQLKDKIINEFGLQDFSSLDLPSIYAVLLSDRRNQLRELLEDTFRVSEYNNLYDNLRGLDVEYLYTTNIDDLPFFIFNARKNEECRLLHDVYQYGAPRLSDSVVQYIPLHGSVKHEDADFLFTSGQMSAAFASDRETWYVFQRELQVRPTIFLGYGLRDAGVLQALHDSSNRSNVNRWILIRKDDAAAKTLYASLGFHVIVGDTEDFLNFVSNSKKLIQAAPRLSRSKFVGEVPAASEIAQRPIRNFFLGAEPEWSDAYSQQVTRRRINSSVQNSIYNGRHVALVGLPLSGKTTILKQVAADIAQSRPALYFDRISDAQADQIIAEQRGEPSKALVFVDNLIDSRESIDKIVNQIGAQMVCAEDSVYFDSANLRSLSSKMDVVSCSEITGQDLQKIIDSIPIDIRRWNVDGIYEIERDLGEVGLFESFRRHVFDENLTSRFRTKLAEFEARDQQAFDIYIMSAYVSACRSVVSFDMIYMFLNNPRKEYKDVYDVIARIGGFMKEIDLDDDHQDFFSVRSGALARIALRETSSKAFTRMYDRFHSAVPSRVIVDYSVFRRYAYDNDYTRRAYPSNKEGIRFYERLVQATDNAYDYQHGAIYLSKGKDFKEAFSWIDTALSKSRGRVYSIRNTHARILFEANIDVAKNDPSDKTAIDGIVESMEVLQEIIVKDQRRSYHLLRFSDQALQYADIIDDDRAREWLLVAHDRLKAMATQAAAPRSRESYNLRKYRNLLSEVGAALARRGVATN